MAGRVSSQARPWAEWPRARRLSGIFTSMALAQERDSPSGPSSGGPASQPDGSTLECEPLRVAELIRAARTEDLNALRDIERAAGQRFRDFGLEAVAEDEPASIEELQDYAAAGRAWVAVGDAGEPVGYILVDEIEGGAH